MSESLHEHKVHTRLAREMELQEATKSLEESVRVLQAVQIVIEQDGLGSSKISLAHSYKIEVRA